MPRRTWTVEEKLAIVLAGLKQTQSVAELCRQHQISQTQYYTWRDQFLEGGKQALLGVQIEQDYNELYPHSALGYRSPAEFEAMLAYQAKAA